MLCLQKLVDSPCLIFLAQTDFAVTVLTMFLVMKSISFFKCAFLQPLRLKRRFLFTSPMTSMHCFFSQKDRMSVFKVILDCLDMTNIRTLHYLTRFPSGASVTALLAG